ncbi:unnamed protein product [Cylindrotheca closterium]|uniref:Uncharacterized protein n=1 Tax=Cylindrotheca closterium TaxID=2856 RepID=A0AAD2GDB1_9STRA|nr:unnamed protein product [Cylindrotheca closterium]
MMAKSVNLLRIWVFIVTTFYLQTVKVQGWSTGNKINGIVYRNQRQEYAIIQRSISINHWNRRAAFSLSSQANDNDNNTDLEMSNFPEPLVWLWSPSSHGDDDSAMTSKDEEWKPISEVSLLPAAIRTWNWSKHFVLKLGLCPWAKGSLDTPSAMQIFVVPKEQDILYTTGTYANDICLAVADKCLQYCQKYPEKESSIIFLVVFQEEDEDADCVPEETTMDRIGGFHDAYDQWEHFINFYEWFTDLEDDWDLDDIIVAPFHPNWQFGGDGQRLLDFEKKSPYPTVTFVSAKVVEQAGEAATAQIAQKNEETLEGKTLDSLQETWDDSFSI